jgi:ABC-2 type transport system permease protein
MIFLCGLFFPIEQLPSFLQPLSYIFPLTYGADILHKAFEGQHLMPIWFDFVMISIFCLGLFLISLRNIQRRWIA